MCTLQVVTIQVHCSGPHCPGLPQRLSSLHARSSATERRPLCTAAAVSVLKCLKRFEEGAQEQAGGWRWIRKSRSISAILTQKVNPNAAQGSRPAIDRRSHSRRHKESKVGTRQFSEAVLKDAPAPPPWRRRT